MSRLTDILALINASNVQIPAEITQDDARLIEAVKLGTDLKVAPITAETLPQILMYLGLAPVALEKINENLATSSFLVGDRLSLADAAVFYSLQKTEVDTLKKFANVARWFDNVQNVLVTTTKVNFSFPVIQLPYYVESAAPKKEEKKEKKEEKKEDKKAPAAAPATDAPKAAEAPAAASPSAPPADANPSLLDVRVGVVVKCWNHPDSDKLLCEEIDLGEGTTRQIASGIRHFYSAEEVQGRKVLVLANLKDRNIAGFKSQGMVLCSVTGNHENVKLAEPPADAKPGDRVKFGDFEGEPASSSQVAKKKYFETLVPFVSLLF